MVPAVSAAVNFLSGTMASFPIEIMDTTAKGKVAAVGDPLLPILHDAPNDEQSSYDWRKGFFDAVFTGGRGLSYIEKNGAGQVVNLWPIDAKVVTVKRKDGRKVYEVRDGGLKTYDFTEVIDITFMDKPDSLGHRSPIVLGRDVIAMAIAATEFGSKVFQSGGSPPIVLQGPFSSGATAQRASDDVARAMAKLADDGRSVMAIPAGHEMKPLGFNAKDSQLLELQEFCIQQIARLYSLPPVFLQDLSHATFSNNEQQDLHLVKHTMHHWVRQFEQELTLKLYGRVTQRKVQLNMDGLLRGDIATRMAAHATAIQNGIYSPAHAALIEDHPVRKEADVILVQGAMVPIGTNTGGLSNGQ